MAGLKGLAVADHGRGLDGRGRIGQPLRGDAALEPGQRLAVGALGAWREALDPAAGEIEGDQLRERGGGGHGDMDARRRAGVKSRGDLRWVMHLASGISTHATIGDAQQYLIRLVHMATDGDTQT